MNYYGAKDLAGSFRTVRKNTITIAEEIGEQHYGFSPAPDTPQPPCARHPVSMVFAVSPVIHQSV